MGRRSLWLVAAAALVVSSVAAVVLVRQQAYPTMSTDEVLRMSRDELTRYMLVDAVKPVKLANCELQRFGEPNDGGYLMCGNLLGSARAGYWYGISNYDQWGCDISTTLGVRVHQYDCFDTRQPTCPTGDTVFHAECIAHEASVDESGRPFDTLVNQLEKNGDGARNVVMKMDVEGAEWDSLLFAPDEVLQRVDQLAIEFHGIQAPKYLATIERLRKFFYVANIHFNNHSCQEGLKPFPAWAYEVLFVSRKLGILDAAEQAEVPNPLDQPNTSKLADCQEWVR